MPAGTFELEGPITQSMDDEVMKKFREGVKYGSGFSTYCEIMAHSEKLFNSLHGMEPHEKLGRMTSYFLENLMNKEDMTDKKKSEILSLAIEVYRKKIRIV